MGLNRKHATQPTFLRKLCHASVRERYSKRTEEGYKNHLLFPIFMGGLVMQITYKIFEYTLTHKQ
jgi:hypothetical protein